MKHSKTSNKREFIIPFVGLKLGVHAFDFSVSDAFFEDMSFANITSGTVHIRLLLEKKEMMLIGKFSCNGRIVTSCDRCNEAVDFPISGAFQIIFTFGSGLSDDESLVVLPTHAYQLDVEQYVHELIVVSLPSRIVHENDTCDPEAINILRQYVIN